MTEQHVGPWEDLHWQLLLRQPKTANFIIFISWTHSDIQYTVYMCLLQQMGFTVVSWDVVTVEKIDNMYVVIAGYRTLSDTLSERFERIQYSSDKRTQNTWLIEEKCHL